VADVEKQPVSDSNDRGLIDVELFGGARMKWVLRKLRCSFQSANPMKIPPVIAALSQSAFSATPGQQHWDILRCCDSLVIVQQQKHEADSL